MKAPASSLTPVSCLPPPIPARRIAALIGGSTTILVLAFHTLLTSSVSAQPVTPATPKPPTPKTQPPQPAKPTAAATPKKAGSVSVSPSRYVEETDLAAYVGSRSAVFSMRERATDPFGRLQDPDAKPVIKIAAAKSSHRAPAVQTTPFSDIVRLIKVTTVMPKEKRFLVGNRAIKEGDSIPLTFRGKNIRVAVSSVTSRQIDFRNLENGETASLKFAGLPGGMTPGTSGITAPGMVPDRPNSPLELDPGVSLTDKSQNR